MLVLLVAATIFWLKKTLKIKNSIPILAQKNIKNKKLNPSSTGSIIGSVLNTPNDANKNNPSGQPVQNGRGQGQTSNKVSSGNGVSGNAGGSSGSAGNGQSAGGGPSSAVPYRALTPGTSWQWQLQDPIDETILDGIANPRKMYDIDLFNVDAGVISRLKAKGIIVICYMSAGSSENWRPDYGSFPASVKGNSLGGWPGENWLDIRQIGVLGPIMTARMDMAKAKGCDGIEPDNIDGYENNSGFTLSAADQANYNRYLSVQAHARNLSIGLKNDVSQIALLEPSFDWALNEECYQFDECGGYSVFIAHNKAVFGVEYAVDPAVFCPQANASNYDWLFKDQDLRALPRISCR